MIIKTIIGRKVKCKSRKTILNRIKRKIWCCPECGSGKIITERYDQYEYTDVCSNCKTVLEYACYSTPFNYTHLLRNKSYINLDNLRKKLYNIPF